MGQVYEDADEYTNPPSEENDFVAGPPKLDYTIGKLGPEDLAALSRWLIDNDYLKDLDADFDGDFDYMIEVATDNFCTEQGTQTGDPYSAEQRTRVGAILTAFWRAL